MKIIDIFQEEGETFEQIMEDFIIEFSILDELNEEGILNEKK